jgi:hypothetical protein
MRAHIAFFLPLCVLWSCSVVNGQWASLLRGKKEETGTAALDSTSNEPQLILYRVLSTDGSYRVLPEKPPSCCRCDDCNDYRCECLCSCGDDDKSAKGGSSKGDDDDSSSSKGSKGSKGGSGNDDDDSSSSKGSKGSKSGSGDDDDGSKSKSSNESKGGSGDDDDDSSSSKGSNKGSKGGYGDDDDDHDKGNGNDDDKGDDDDDNGDDDKDDDSYSSKGSKGDDDDDRYGSKGSKGDDDDDGYGSKGSKGDDDDVGISSKGSKGNDDDDGYGSKGSKGDDDDGYGSKGSKGDDDDGYSSKGSKGSRGDDDDDNDDDKGDDDDDKGDDDDDDDKGDDDDDDDKGDDDDDDKGDDDDDKGDDDDDKGDDDDDDDKGDDDDGGCSGSKIKIVAPNKLENLDGLDGSDLSFCLEAFNETDLRQQNFYSSDQFQDLSGPMLITKVALRVTRIFGPPQVTGPIITPQKVTFDAEFRLSTTPVGGLQGLSTTFSENYGKNGVTTVLRDKTWELKTEGNNPDLERGVPNPFDIFIKLDTPYLYDPSKGNLNFEYIIRRLETINCSLPPIAAGETNMLGPYIDAPPSVSPGDDIFNKVRLLYSFDVTSPVGLFEEAAPVARFTFEDPSCN